MKSIISSINDFFTLNKTSIKLYKQYNELRDKLLSNKSNMEKLYNEILQCINENYYNFSQQEKFYVEQFLETTKK